MKNFITITCIISILSFFACKKEKIQNPPIKSGPTYIQLDIPQGFPAMVIPEDNPFTKEGIELGRKLFYEKKLSGNNTLSCGSCHSPSLGFSDSSKFSVGIDGVAGKRQSMALINLGWANRYFWDGRATTLEEQAFFPVRDTIELHETWPNAVAKLQADSEYPALFESAFGTTTIDSNLVAKAIAQFERTLISGNSKFDKILRFEMGFTPQEANGYSLFNSLTGGDCFHCHGGVLTTDHSFQNNGLNLVHTDLGLAISTGNPSDEGKFKVPTLRNIALTAPYMHDGRFNTLEEVLDFYSTGLHSNSPNISPNMEFAGNGGVNLSPSEKADIIAFLHTLTDMDFVTNPNFQAPNP